MVPACFCGEIRKLSENTSYLELLDAVVLWCSGFSEVCMVCYCTGAKKSPSESNIEVDIHDGDDGGIVMEVHRRRGTFYLGFINVFSHVILLSCFILKGSFCFCYVQRTIKLV